MADTPTNSRKKPSSPRPVAPQVPPAGVSINLALCKYGVFGRVAEKLGWDVSEDDNCDVLWADAGHAVERFVRSAKSFQRINHFPGMVNIYRKDRLARSMSRMSRISSHFAFTPKTWILPEDFAKVCYYLRCGSKRTVIMKPSAGAQGRGILLANCPEQIITSDERYIVQSYIHRPLLINNFKFDMRIYVLVTSSDPLRVLLYREGLCRFCTYPYQAPNKDNISNSYMHLTNYSINKHNESFVQNNGSNEDQEISSKRSISWLRKWLRKHGHDDNEMWRGIADIVVKTLISIQTPLARAFQSAKVDGQNKNPFTCFELLGFDIILDHQCRPMLLEVNHMPSFSTDSSLDSYVKESLIANTLQLLNVSSREREEYQKSSAMVSQMRLYGDLFDDKQRGEDSAKTLRKNSTSEGQYWQRYLDNERRHLGYFDLVYPTNVYEHQPTEGKQALYDDLLGMAEVALDSGLSGMRSFGEALTVETEAEDAKKKKKKVRKSVARSSADLSTTAAKISAVSVPVPSVVPAQDKAVSKEPQMRLNLPHLVIESQSPVLREAEIRTPVHAEPISLSLAVPVSTPPMSYSIAETPRRMFYANAPSPRFLQAGDSRSGQVLTPSPPTKNKPSHSLHLLQRQHQTSSSTLSSGTVGAMCVPEQLYLSSSTTETTSRLYSPLQSASSQATFSTSYQRDAVSPAASVTSSIGMSEDPNQHLDMLSFLQRERMRDLLFMAQREYSQDNHTLSNDEDVDDDNEETDERTVDGNLINHPEPFDHSRPATVALCPTREEENASEASFASASVCGHTFSVDDRAVIDKVELAHLNNGLSLHYNNNRNDGTPSLASSHSFIPTPISIPSYHPPSSTYSAGISYPFSSSDGTTAPFSTPYSVSYSSASSTSHIFHSENAGSLRTPISLSSVHFPVVPSMPTQSAPSPRPFSRHMYRTPTVQPASQSNYHTESPSNPQHVDHYPKWHLSPALNHSNLSSPMNNHFPNRYPALVNQHSLEASHQYHITNGVVA